MATKQRAKKRPRLETQIQVEGEGAWFPAPPALQPNPYHTGKQNLETLKQLMEANAAYRIVELRVARVLAVRRPRKAKGAQAR